MSGLAGLVRARRMRRVYAATQVDPDWLDATLNLAANTPSAGNTQGLDWLVLADPGAVAQYWSITLGERSETFTHQGLIDAPVLVIAISDPGAYVTRYREQDKKATGLGTRAESWPVPYWFVDAGMAIQTLLLAVEEANMSACLFGLFDHERAVLDFFGVPASHRAVGTIAIGHRDPGVEPPGRSATRPRRRDVIHRARW